MEISPDWLMPPAALGQLLARAPGREREAEEVLRAAVKLDPSSGPLLFALAELRRRAGDSPAALELLRRATDEGDSPSAAMWLARAELEQAGRDTASALKSLASALKLDPENAFARYRRAELYFETKDGERALQDLRSLEGAAKADAGLALSVASLYARAGDKASALRVIDALPEQARRSPDAERMRASLVSVNCDPAPEARDALEKLLVSEPDNASLHACLGELYRTSDPPRSLEHFRRAAELDRSNVKYATGYAAALIQLRRFDEAAALLRRVVSAAPTDYVARANYATALYELKLYRQALDEYAWMSTERPELAVIDFFVGTAHDRLGEYEEALRAYEKFLARADARANQLEIDKVNLRLPSLRNQIKRGEGVKRKVGR
jgi:tetratricopeptide (TPR) repeat protein